MENTPIIQIENVSFRYDEDGQEALKNISLSIEKGEFTAILGHNGSGKSTLAKLINAIYLPTEGRVTVLGMDTKDEKRLWDIRQHAGMIFQNPDNQIVATVVKEDVAFGLENMGVPHDEMVKRIDEALLAVRMTEFQESAPHMLSGGQKQRVAIAGVLAMAPDVIIADEATAMLDPTGREEVFNTLKKLNKEKGITVLWITHFMEEAARCNRVIIINEGQLNRDGTPREIFAHVDELKALHLDVPPMTELCHRLIQHGIEWSGGILSVEEMVKEVEKRVCLSK
jgi:ABC-type cobalt transport system, ATPase component